MFVGGNLVSWQSKKQPVVARSTTETKYKAMTLGVAEILWLKKFIKRSQGKSWSKDEVVV
jgi:hypothetical protein